MKLILTSACDDNYVPLLLDMMESLGSQLKKHDFGLLDLGLSEANIKKIRKLKPEVIIKKPKWFLDLPEHLKNIFSQATHSKPFVKKNFPNYDGYMHLDADLWFLDSSAIGDYIKAAEKTGFSITTETHETIRVLASKIRSTDIFGMTFMRGIKSYNYNIVQKIFGTKEAVKYALNPPINSGLYFIHADSPVWEAWQEAMQSANWHNVKKMKLICDQTCLFYALHKYNLPHTLLSIHHNWVLNSTSFLLDTAQGKLLDPTYPHKPIKVVHLINKTDRQVFSIKTTDDDTIKTKLTRKEFLRNYDR